MDGGNNGGVQVRAFGSYTHICTYSEVIAWRCVSIYVQRARRTARSAARGALALPNYMRAFCVLRSRSTNSSIRSRHGLSGAFLCSSLAARQRIRGGGGTNLPFLFRMNSGKKCRVRRFQMNRYIKVFARPPPGKKESSSRGGALRNRERYRESGSPGRK